MDLSNYSKDEIELIDLLWKGATIKRSEQLQTRDNILKDKFIYKKIGYFSNVDLD